MSHPWTTPISFRPVDLGYLERETHYVALRQNGIEIAVPVEEIEIDVAEGNDVCGLLAGGTDHIHGTVRPPKPPPSVPCETCGAPSPAGECLDCFEKSDFIADDDARTRVQHDILRSITVRWARRMFPPPRQKARAVLSNNRGRGLLHKWLQLPADAREQEPFHAYYKKQMRRALKVRKIQPRLEALVTEIQAERERLRKLVTKQRHLRRRLDELHGRGRW